MTNAPAPFYPPVPADVLAEIATKRVPERIVKAKVKVFDLMLKAVSGFWELPPRQQWALYLAAEMRFMEQGLTIVDLFLMMEKVWAPEALKHAKNYKRLSALFAKRAEAKRPNYVYGAKVARPYGAPPVMPAPPMVEPEALA